MKADDLDLMEVKDNFRKVKAQLAAGEIVNDYYHYAA